MRCLIHNDTIEVYQSQLFQTNSTIIKTKNAIVLVDPNWLPNEIEFLQKKVNELIEKNQLVLLFTHSDYDHIIGYGAFESNTTIASASFISNLKKNKILNQIAAFDDANYIVRTYPITYPQISNAVSFDGEIVDIMALKIKTYQAKGHNDDGILAYFESEKTLVLGDYLCNVEFPYIYYSSTEYEKTLEKIEHLLLHENIEFVIPGHGKIMNKEQSLSLIHSNRKYIAALRNAVLNNNQLGLMYFDVPQTFPKIMTKFHNANVKLIKKELQK
jgi:hydroxyacylglutathione hydrolase